MIRIKDLSIKRKLLLIILLTNFITIGAGFAFIIINNYKNSKDQLVKDHLLDAKLIGDYCVAPLTFDDKRGAAEILSKLESKPDIISGILYDAKKSVFATYISEFTEQSEPDTIPSETYYEFTEGACMIWEPIKYNNEIYGFVFLKASTSAIQLELTRQILFSALLLVILLLVALLFGNRFQRIISTPVLKLASIADQISRSKDYSIRTKKLANDEIGKLYDAFNEMLDIIFVNEKERDHAIRELEISEKKFRSYIESSPTVILITNNEMELEYVNNTANELLQTGDITQDGPVKVIDFVPMDLRHRFSTMFSSVISGISIQMEFKFLSLKQNEIDVIMHGKKLSADQNIIYCTNITRLKVIEKELIAAKDKAEESDRLKSSFLANMSHEIRTPMNGIMGFAELLKNRDIRGEKQQEYINIIQKSGKRMLNIINDLIDISKIEAGQVKVSKSVTNINQIVDDLYQFFLPEARGKGLKLLQSKELQPDDSNIITDSAKVIQVLTNLVKNAIKYTNTGQVIFGYEIENEMVKFYVQDTGIGIKESLQKEIFERFRQAELDFSKEYEGAGLGLSISRAFIEMLGGNIWLESEIGKGSTFYFTIPYQQEKSHSDHSAKKSKNTFTGQPKLSKILIAEDDDTSYLLIEECFLSNNVILLRASTGQTAVNQVKTDKDIDVVLMDIKMPEMNGFEATSIIKKIRPELPVIAITAFALEGDSEKAYNAGCDGYLAKPIKKEDLLQSISKVLKPGKQ